MVREVFPALRERLRDRLVELVDVDLRWGIRPEEAERGEVLDVCLDEIDQCRPYFIGLLGERYGWIPLADQYPAGVVDRHPWLLEHKGGTSVTELGIRHGVLDKLGMGPRTRFFLPRFRVCQEARWRLPTQVGRRSSPTVPTEAGDRGFRTSRLALCQPAGPGCGAAGGAVEALGCGVSGLRCPRCLRAGRATA